MTYAGVADTHTALWYRSADPRLSPSAKQHIDDAASRGEKVGVSAISLAELVYLVEKGRVPQTAMADLLEALATSAEVFTEVPVDNLVVRAMWEVPRSEVPDLPDRIIAATAVHLNVPVISRDGKIRAANLRSIW